MIKVNFIEGENLLTFDELKIGVLYESEGNDTCLYLRANSKELLFFRRDGTSFGPASRPGQPVFKEAGKGTEVIIRN